MKQAKERDEHAKKMLQQAAEKMDQLDFSSDDSSDESEWGDEEEGFQSFWKKSVIVPDTNLSSLPLKLKEEILSHLGKSDRSAMSLLNHAWCEEITETIFRKSYRGIHINSKELAEIARKQQLPIPLMSWRELLVRVHAMKFNVRQKFSTNLFELHHETLYIELFLFSTIEKAIAIGSPHRMISDLAQVYLEIAILLSDIQEDCSITTNAINTLTQFSRRFSSQITSIPWLDSVSRYSQPYIAKKLLQRFDTLSSDKGSLSRACGQAFPLALKTAQVETAKLLFNRMVLMLQHVGTIQDGNHPETFIPIVLKTIDSKFRMDGSYFGHFGLSRRSIDPDLTKPDNPFSTIIPFIRAASSEELFATLMFISTPAGIDYRHPALFGWLINAFIQSEQNAVQNAKVFHYQPINTSGASRSSEQKEPVPAPILFTYDDPFSVTPRAIPKHEDNDLAVKLSPEQESIRYAPPGEEEEETDENETEAFRPPAIDWLPGEILLYIFYFCKDPIDFIHIAHTQEFWHQLVFENTVLRRAILPILIPHRLFQLRLRHKGLAPFKEKVSDAINPHIHGPHNRTILHELALMHMRINSYRLADVLLEKKRSPLTVSSGGRTPLHYALSTFARSSAKKDKLLNITNFNMLKLVFLHGLLVGHDVKQIVRDVLHPIHPRLANEALEALLRHVAGCPNLASSLSGDTVFHCIARNNDLNLAYQTVAGNTHYYSVHKNIEGKTPIDLAVENSDPELCHWFHTRELALQQNDEVGFLFYLVSHYPPYLVARYFNNHRVSPQNLRQQKNHKKRNTLQCSASAGHEDTLAFLYQQLKTLCPKETKLAYHRPDRYLSPEILLEWQRRAAKDTKQAGKIQAINKDGSPKTCLQLVGEIIETIRRSAGYDSTEYSRNLRCSVIKKLKLNLLSDGEAGRNEINNALQHRLLSNTINNAWVCYRYARVKYDKNTPLKWNSRWISKGSKVAKELFESCQSAQSAQESILFIIDCLKVKTKNPDIKQFQTILKNTLIYELNLKEYNQPIAGLYAPEWEDAYFIAFLSKWAQEHLIDKDISIAATLKTGLK